jgi:uncharacterized protein (DUF1499 family)
MTRIEYAADQEPTFLARWASRIAVFCAVLLVVTLFLHRLFALSTPVALNIAFAAFSGAGIVLVMALIAGIDIWITGRQGAARIVSGAVVALGLLAVPLSLWVISHEWPAINDVSTDTGRPPQFTEISKLREAGSNTSDYRGEDFAALQLSHYPDLKPLIVQRSSDEAFEIVLQALGKLRLKTLSEVPPAAAPDGAGSIELSDHTLILGFVDDIAIRIVGEGPVETNAARIDIRSASRFGRHDFGHNAEGVRSILREIVGRLEATVPSGDKKPAATPQKDGKALIKRPEARDRPSAGARSKPTPSRSKTRRGPEPSE